MKGLLLPALLIVIAEIGVRLHGQSDAIAPPSQAIVAFGEALADGSLIAATRDTLIAAFCGLALGATIGLALGVALGLSRALDRLLELPVEILRPIPSVAVIPVALVALGFGYRLEIAIVAFSSVWPMLIFSRAAVAGVEPRLLEVARALRLTPWATVAKILIPAALPRIFVAFRLAAGVALIVAVTVEIAVNPQGLGAALMTAGQALRPDLTMAFLIWVGLVGFLLNQGLLAVEARLFGR
jgi:ABC-type nitrate/sulfonate/bicarbonate transport system permease component